MIKKREKGAIGTGEEQNEKNAGASQKKRDA